MPSPAPDPADDPRPTKKRALDATSRQAAHLEALFANPSKAVLPTSKPKAVDAPPEIVTNVGGSSAGAGSGEFFVYKAARRKEYDRLAAMDAESAKEAADAEWARQKAEREAKDAQRGAKGRARREKAKMKRLGKGEEAKKTVVMEFKRPADDDGDAESKKVEDEGITIHDDD